MHERAPGALLLSPPGFPISVHSIKLETLVRLLALRTVVAFLIVALATTTAHAQARRARRAGAGPADRPQIGGHVGYIFDGGNAFIGAQASLPVARQVDAYPSFDYYFVSGATLWSLNLDARFRPRGPYRYGYLGAGLNLSHASVSGFGSNTDTNLNLFGGLEGKRGRMRPFAEARLIVGNGSSFQIQGGVNVPLR